MLATVRTKAIHRKLETIGALAFVGLFALLTSAPLLVKCFVGRAAVLMEKRTLSGAPSWPESWAEAAAFPKAFDTYVNDNFGLRSELIVWNSFLRYRLGVSGSPKVLVGKRGWLFYRSDPDLDSMFVRGTRRLAQQEVAGWVRRMADRSDWLSARGIAFVILPAPLKETIYPEYLPATVRQVSRETEIDQLVRAALESRKIPLVDVRQALRSSKEGKRAVYGPYDTHWTYWGAYIAYRAVLEHIGQLLPALQPLHPEGLSFRQVVGALSQRDLVNMLGLERFIQVQSEEYVPRHPGRIRIEYLTSRQDWASPQIIHTGLQDAPSLVLIGDSYSNVLLPFFEEHFQWILHIHPQDGFPQALIEKYRPSAVVLEVQESALCVM